MTEITKEQNALDFEDIINNLDQRGCLVLQALLGQRAYTLLKESEPVKPKSSIIQNKPKLVVP